MGLCNSARPMRPQNVDSLAFLGFFLPTAGLRHGKDTSQPSPPFLPEASLGLLQLKELPAEASVRTRDLGDHQKRRTGQHHCNRCQVVSGDLARPLLLRWAAGWSLRFDEAPSRL